MSYLNEMFGREIEGLLNPWNYVFLGIGLSLMFIVFGVIYLTQGVEYFKADGKYSDFEKTFTQKLLQYWLWAFIQQSIVFTVLLFIPLSYDFLYVIGVALFSFVFHLPNVRLMVFTFSFSLLFYYAYFFAGFTSLILLAFLHGFGGSLYYKLGWDMRVWRFK